VVQVLDGAACYEMQATDEQTAVLLAAFQRCKPYMSDKELEAAGMCLEELGWGQ
jgi:hypothetical protein